MELPALTELERAGLVESIRQYGIKYPVLLDPTGAVIDGHHRQAIAAELGINCPTRTLKVTPEQAAELAISLNTDRRQLDRNTRRKLCIQLRAMHKSEREIAEELGISQPTVHRELVSGDSHESPETLPNVTVGKDGKSYPAKKPRDFKAIHQRRVAKAAQKKAADIKAAEQRETRKRIDQTNREHLDNSARNAPAGKLNIPALNRARKLRDDLQKLAELVPPDRFVTQIPIEACREFTPEFVDWWLEVSRLAGERFTAEGDGLRPLPSRKRTAS